MPEERSLATLISMVFWTEANQISPPFNLISTNPTTTIMIWNRINSDPNSIQVMSNILPMTNISTSPIISQRPKELIWAAINLKILRRYSCQEEKTSWSNKKLTQKKNWGKSKDRGRRVWTARKTRIRKSSNLTREGVTSKFKKRITSTG